jgi:NAD(P)-dependent dehydrogenase (short-subunit alcohol dehydrogenase family)
VHPVVSAARSRMSWPREQRGSLKRQPGGFGGLDGLVNAAGVVAFGSLADHDDDTIEELFLTNAMGPLWLVRGVLRLMHVSEGFVVQLSAAVAERIVHAIEVGDTSIPSTAF